jgi:hypothetical protein
MGDDDGSDGRGASELGRPTLTGVGPGPGKNIRTNLTDAAGACVTSGSAIHQPSSARADRLYTAEWPRLCHQGNGWVHEKRRRAGKHLIINVTRSVTRSVSRALQYPQGSNTVRKIPYPPGVPLQPREVGPHSARGRRSEKKANSRRQAGVKIAVTPRDGPGVVLHIYLYIRPG